MGESIEEGTISAILKQEGDAVEMDEAIFQIETDKVTVDVRAPEAGVIDKIMVRCVQALQLKQKHGCPSPEAAYCRSSKMTPSK